MIADEVAARELEWSARNAAVVEEERQRISREPHDVVGHALAGISLTAGAAEQQQGSRDPEMAAALHLIRTTSRDAASDVRRLVGLLREGSDEPSASDTEPQPTLSSVAALVSRSREAGLDVSYEVSGAPVAVPGGLHLTTYRLIQEGLTNVAKHAPTASASVLVSWSPGCLEVAVVNTAPAASGSSPGTDLVGHGLIGLAERVTLYDGTLAR